MPRIDERAIASAEQMRPTHLEAQIIDGLAARKGLSVSEAPDFWYRSELSSSVERNDYGLQYLDANYLVDEVLKRQGG